MGLCLSDAFSVQNGMKKKEAFIGQYAIRNVQEKREELELNGILVFLRVLIMLFYRVKNNNEKHRNIIR